MHGLVSGQAPKERPRPCQSDAISQEPGTGSIGCIRSKIPAASPSRKAGLTKHTCWRRPTSPLPAAMSIRIPSPASEAHARSTSWEPSSPHRRWRGSTSPGFRRGTWCSGRRSSPTHTSDRRRHGNSSRASNPSAAEPAGAETDKIPHIPGSMPVAAGSAASGAGGPPSRASVSRSGRLCRSRGALYAPLQCCS